MKIDHIEPLVQKIHSLSDLSARDTALELVRAVMGLHAEALERMMEIVSGAEGGASIIDSFGADDLVGSVLLLHDLHPLDLEQRVWRALDQPEFRARGASVELVSIDNGTVRVRVHGGPALHLAVEQAITDAAPDALGISVESEDNSKSNFVPLTQLLAG